LFSLPLRPFRSTSNSSFFLGLECRFYWHVRGLPLFLQSGTFRMEPPLLPSRFLYPVDARAFFIPFLKDPPPGGLRVRGFFRPQLALILVYGFSLNPLPLVSWKNLYVVPMPSARPSSLLPPRSSRSLMGFYVAGSWRGKCLRAWADRFVFDSAFLWPGPNVFSSLSGPRVCPLSPESLFPPSFASLFALPLVVVLDASACFIRLYFFPLHLVPRRVSGAPFFLTEAFFDNDLPSPIPRNLSYSRGQTRFFLSLL